ncbi:MAG TPA: DUF2000 domain-containing protein [Candidatus Saccharimonadales bacterium]|nr:DUF2000 domain-containing protein [Candidatus Saccharimonadales bacterium]
MTLPDETTYRFVAVLNKKAELGRLLNALGHMTAGLVGAYSKTNDLCFLEYHDADGGLHPSISHFPFIVLKADNSNQIRTLRAQLIEKGLPCNDFTSTMTVGSSEEQQEATRNTPEAELEYFGVCTFGTTDTLKTLTKKFQLFR